MINHKTLLNLSIALLVLLSSTALPARERKANLPSFSFGDRSRAEAGVVADILDQLYLGHVDAEDGYMSFDGEFRISLEVKRVLFGPVSTGPLAVNTYMHTYLNAKSRNNEFYLTRSNHGEWWIADHP